MHEGGTSRRASRSSREGIPGSALLRKFARAARLLGGTSVVVASIVLVGWMFAIPTLTSVSPGLASMKPNSACGFLLLGVAIYEKNARTPNRSSYVATACAWGALFLGVATLLEYGFGWDLGIDQLLFVDRGGQAHPGRMAPVSAANFVLLSAGVLLLDAPSRWGSHAAAAIVLASATLALFGYVFGASSLYKVGVFHSVALPTAFLFALLALALLFARADGALMRPIVSNTAGGAATRRILPALFVVPLVVGKLRVMGEDHGLYDTPVGIAVLVFANVASLVALVLWNAFRLDREEAASSVLGVELAARSERARSEVSFRALVDRAPIGIQVIGGGKVRYVNAAYVRLLGYELPEDLVGRTALEQVREEARKDVSDRLAAASLGPTSTSIPCRRSDGVEIEIEGTIVPMPFEGEPSLVVMAKDVTDSVRLERAREEALASLRESLLEKDRLLDELRVAQSAERLALAVREETAKELAQALVWNRAVLDAANISIISTRPDGVIIGWNRTAERWLEYDADAIIEKETPGLIHEPAEVVARAAVLSRELGETIAPGFQTFVAKVARGVPDEQEWTYVARSGRRFPVHLSVTGLWAASGELVGYLGVGRDLTLQRLAEAKVREVTTSLRTSEERFRAASEGGFDAIVFLESIRDEAGALQDFRFVDLNERAAVFIGKRRDEIIELLFFATFPSALSQNLRESFLTVLETQAPFEHEYVATAGAVEGRWIRIQVIPVGESGLSLTIRDIHDKKVNEAQLEASLRQKEVLLMEVHHRVKNNLQIICSLLNMQAGHLDDPAPRAALEEAQMRVQAIALAHEQLYSSNDLANVNLAEHARAVVLTLTRALGTDTRNVTLDVSASPCSVGIALAIPCGLILNELVSNALKHAFPGRGGHVLISLEAEQGIPLALTVEDDGIGLPSGFDFSRSRSLGVRLVVALTRQIGATLEVGAGAVAGARFHIRFKRAQEIR